MAEDRHSAEEKGEYDYEGDMAKSQLKSIITNAQRMHDMLEETTNLPEWVQSKITLAEDYILTATSYMEGEMSEEYSIQERINMAKAKMGDVIKDFYKSDAPQFAGRSKSKRRQMAIAAKLGAMRKSRMSEELKGNQHKIDANKNNKIDAQDFKLLRSKMKMKKEEVEQIGEAPYMGKGNHKPGWMLRADPELARKFKEIEDRKKRMNSLMKTYGGKTGDEIAKMKKEEVEQVNELKKSTLGSYIKKASSSAVINTRTAAAARNTKPTVYSSSTGDFEHRPDPQPYEKKVSKRLAGISKAVNKMAKEEVEQVDEVIGNTTGYSDSGPRNKADERKFHQMRNVVTKGPRTGKITKYAQNRLKDRLKTKTYMEEVEIDEGAVKATNKFKKRLYQAAQSATKVTPQGNAAWTRAAAIRMTRDKMKKEEVERVDELKKSTLGSYIKKASKKYGGDKQVVGRESPDGTVAKARPEVRLKLKNRMRGIERAADRLAN